MFLRKKSNQREKNYWKYRIRNYEEKHVVIKKLLKNSRISLKFLES
jgi:hypothetical protein